MIVKRQYERDENEIECVRDGVSVGCGELMTSLSKSRAWALAAEWLEQDVDVRIGHWNLREYIRTNIIPSLKRRAAIIKRGAKERK